MKKASLELYYFSSVLPEFNPTGKEMKIEKSKEKSCHILLESIWPIFKLAQIIGIAPVNFHQGALGIRQVSPQLTKYSKGSDDCPKLVADKFSIPSIINGVLTIHLSWITIWVLVHLKWILEAVFSGTDLYTFMIQIQIYFMQTFLILFNAFWRRNGLVKLWNLLHEVYQRLNSLQMGVNGCYGIGSIIMEKYLRRLRRFSFLAVILIFIFGLTYSSYFLNYALQICFKSVEEISKLKLQSGRVPICVFDNWVLLIEKMTYIFIDIYQQCIASLFAVFCFIVWIMNKEIGKRLKMCLLKQNRESVYVNKAQEIENLRISHEMLSKCTRVIGEFFGTSILFTCIAAVISITSAIYTVVLSTSGLTKEQSELDITSFCVIWAFHGFLGLFSLLLILVSGQMVQNSACIPFRVIGLLSHENLQELEKYEITIFLQKQRGSTGISACNISTIGLSFLAAAATNVTTYILVLLQFRLGVDKT